jgi:hypothetical protein
VGELRELVVADLQPFVIHVPDDAERIGRRFVVGVPDVWVPHPATSAAAAASASGAEGWRDASASS